MTQFVNRWTRPEKSYAALITLLLICACLMVFASVSASANEHPNLAHLYVGPPIVDENFDDTQTSMEVSTRDGGSVEIKNRALHLRGKVPGTSMDQFLLTTGLAGRPDIADFVIEFDYTPNIVAWNDDKLLFHSDGGEGKSYALRVTGAALGQGTAHLSLHKNAMYDQSLATTAISLEEGVTYHIRVAMIGAEIFVWMHEKSTTAPDAPTLTLVDSHFPNMIGEFYFTSWAGDFYIDNLRIFSDL